MRRVSARTLKCVLNLWPPFLFSGVHVAALADDFKHARVELRMRPWNRNYVGTHFGGSLFAMTDPFWMLLVMNALGSEYIVWDQAAEITFLKPGRGTVTAEFELSDSFLNEIRSATASGQKYLHWFETVIADRNRNPIAQVRKQIYIRRKPGR